MGLANSQTGTLIVEGKVAIVGADSWSGGCAGVDQQLLQGGPLAPHGEDDHGFQDETREDTLTVSRKGFRDFAEKHATLEMIFQGSAGSAPPAARYNVDGQTSSDCRDTIKVAWSQDSKGQDHTQGKKARGRRGNHGSDSLDAVDRTQQDRKFVR